MPKEEKKKKEPTGGPAGGAKKFNMGKWLSYEN